MKCINYIVKLFDLRFITHTVSYMATKHYMSINGSIFKGNIWKPEIVF